MLRGKISLLFIVCVALLAIPAIALADELRSSHNTFTADASVLSLQSGGASDTVSVRLNQDNRDGDYQCNVDTNETLTIKANTSNSSAATVKWAANNSDTIAFVGCQGNAAQNLTVTSGSAGTANITFSIVTNTTGVGTNDLTTKAPFTVNVAPPPNTAPIVSVTGVQDGATSEHGAVPAAACNVSDAEDTTESANPVKDSTGLNSYGLGLETITCSYTDAGGLTTAARATYTITDTTKPNIAAHGDVTAEATGPNGAEVTYTAPTTNDAVYGSVDVECLPASGSQFDLGDTTVTCTATDGSGNEATPTTFKVTVADTTKPELSLPANITEEATGPNGAAVSFNATASDLVNGNVDVTCDPASGSIFALGTTTVDCSATDAANNTATGSFTVKVQDTIAPSNIQFVGNINDGGSFFFSDVPAQPTCTATDGGSGLNAAGCVVSGYSTAVGTHTLKATATDKAGNTATKEISYTVKPYTLNGFYQPIDMNDTVNTVKNGSTVPVKFELFKGGTELTSTSAVTSILARPMSCGALSGDPEDPIETLATGGTSLRYDATAGQFIYNWTTPKGASQVGKCYSLTMTAADSSTMTAYFKLK